MRFTPEFLDELRSRLSVSEVVGRRIALKKAGREWKGLSPFNKERTPSFFVNDEKAMWFDFSSGRNGSIFDFVMETEGLSFPEAVEQLAGMAGMTLPVASAETERREQHRRTLHEVMELAAKFYQAQLAGRAGAGARGYLADRGLDPATQLKFRLGYAPADRFALKEHLGAQKVPVVDMAEAGLVIAGDDIPVPYDRFRDRVMFPITDTRGRVIAFGGRALQADVPAKYLNSPETPLFHKGGTLYNIAAARAAAHTGAPIVVVEGYVDVIAMVGAGFPGAVAPLGTALTEDQLGLLWKMADEPVLCLDGDAAGRRAAYRIIDVALARLSAGKSLAFATLPPGQDPDDLARSGGAGAVREVVASAVPLAAMLWTRETEGASLDTPERRAAFEARLAALTSSIADPAVRKFYREDFARRQNALFAPAAPHGGRFAQNSRFQKSGGWNRPGERRPGAAGAPLAPPSSRLAASPIVRGFRSALPPREAIILLAVINHPWLLDSHGEEFSAMELRHPDADRLRRAILDVVGHAADHEPLEPEALRLRLAEAGLQPVLARLEQAITHSSDWPAREGAAADDVTQWWNHVITLHHKQRTLNNELKEAERALGERPSEENFRWLRDLQERLGALEGSEATIEDFGSLSGRARSV